MNTQDKPQVPLFDETADDLDELDMEDTPFAVLWDDDDEGFAENLGFDLVPILLPDTDPARALARQKEMMDTVFGGIGVETKPEKQMGLAMQQLDIEQRHALRLLLIYQDAAELTRHLNRCLADPTYGYGERGDQGRTIAQALAALNGSQTDVGELAAAWLDSYRDFQQNALSGAPFSFLSMFETGELDSFVPLVQRTGETTWRLGVEGEGKVQEFHGPMADIWPRLGDTYVAWSEADNDRWLTDLKKKATRLTPDSIFRAARAERLRRDVDTLTVSQGGLLTLTSQKEEADWPRTVTMVDEEGSPWLGLSRLSGHNFYELSWNGGFNTRRFEISSTTRQKVPFEHIELALWLAETLGADLGLTPEPTTPAQVEIAYLRRMKAKSAQLSAPNVSAAELPKGVSGQPMAAYTVEQVTATLLAGDERSVAYIVDQLDQAHALLLQRDPRKGALLALTLSRGRLQRGGPPLMSTPLAELDFASPAVNRALAAWGCWLVWATSPKRKTNTARRQDDGDDR